MKKNGFLTFCFAFIPGAGQMYQGYMKRGLSMVAVCAAEYGMRRFDMIRDAFRYSVAVSFVSTIAMSVILALCAGPLSSVFTVSDDLSYLYGDMNTFDTSLGKDEENGIRATYVGGAMNYDIALLEVSGTVK